MEVKSMAQARRKIKEAQAQANAERVKRERDNVEDAAVVMVELGKIGAVDTWEAEQLREVQVEAERRRDERRSEAAIALRRMQDRGETLTAISDLVGVPVAELRALAKVAVPATAQSADAASGRSGGVGSAGAGSGSDALGGAAGSSPGNEAGALASDVDGADAHALGGDLAGASSAGGPA